MMAAVETRPLGPEQEFRPMEVLMKRRLTQKFLPPLWATWLALSGRGLLDA
jgi:hypothetical protein